MEMLVLHFNEILTRPLIFMNCQYIKDMVMSNVSDSNLILLYNKSVLFSLISVCHNILLKLNCGIRLE